MAATAHEQDPDLRALLQQQSEELDALRATVAALARRVDAERRTAGPSDAPAHPTTPEPAATVATGLPRRDLLRGAAIAAGAVGVGAAGMVATATPAAAAQGFFNGAPAVLATGVGGPGVSATTDEAYGAGVAATTSAEQAIGVAGYSQYFHGIHGSNSSPDFAAVLARNDTAGPALTAFSGIGRGVHAQSNGSSGTALYADATTGVQTTSYRRQLSLGAGPVTDPTQSVGFAYTAGDIVCDTAGVLWFCIAAGSPGTWRRLSAPNVAGAFTLLPAPVRVYDSRPGKDPVAVGPKTKLTNGTERPVDAHFGGAGIPTGATGVVMNLAVTNTGGGGFLGAYRTGVAWPGNASTNWGLANSSLNVSCVTAVDATGSLTLRCGGSTDVIVDVVGYYR